MRFTSDIVLIVHPNVLRVWRSLGWFTARKTKPRLVCQLCGGKGHVGRCRRRAPAEPFITSQTFDLRGFQNVERIP